MPWDTHLFSSIALLVLLQGSKVNGVSQENVYVIECIRDTIPMQIFNECCVRENNCTLTRQQNRGIDCMSRMIMSNYSYAFLNSNDGGSQTTQNPYDNHYNNHNNQWYGDVLQTLSEICRRQPKVRLQNCIRNELIKLGNKCSSRILANKREIDEKLMLTCWGGFILQDWTQLPLKRSRYRSYLLLKPQRCRYSMLQDRITSPPGRWNQGNGDYSPNNNDRYGGGGTMMDRRRFPQVVYGNRRNHDTSSNYNTRSDYGDSQGGGYSQGNYPRGSYNNEDSDEEDFGYLDGDSMRYK